MTLYGILSCFKFLQLAKARVPIVVTVLGIVTLLTAFGGAKTNFEICLSYKISSFNEKYKLSEDKEISFNKKQLPNVFFPIDFTPLPILISFKLLQLKNASEPIDVTEYGI